MPRMRSVVVSSLGVAAVAGVTGAAVAVVRAATKDRLALNGIDELDVQVDDPFTWTPDATMWVTADDGTRLYAEIDEPAGHQARPTVVFSHGFCLAAGSWIHQRRALVDAGYRCVLWDQRGHGRSGSGAVEQCTIDQLGRDLARVIEATTPEGPLVLVGHSMGGMTVMSFGDQFAEEVARRVRAVVFVATSPGGQGLLSLGFGRVFGGALTRFGPRLLSGIAARPGLWQRTRTFGRDVESLFVQRFSFASPVSDATVRFCADMLLSTDLEVVGAFLATFEVHDKNAALDVFASLPELVVNGAGDVLTPPEHSAALVAANPAAEHLLIAEAGHLVMLEHPGLVNLHLLGLVDRVAEAHAATVRAGVTEVADERRSGLVETVRARRAKPARRGSVRRRRQTTAEVASGESV